MQMAPLGENRLLSDKDDLESGKNKANRSDITRKYYVEGAQKVGRFKAGWV